MQSTGQPGAGGDFHVKIGTSGRMVLPAALRERHQMRPGDTLVFRSRDDGAVEVRTRDQVLREALDYFAALAPADRILSEELIRERHLEAEAE